MPYEVVGSILKGWFVQKKGTAKHYSKKPFRTKKEAIKQMQAIIISEHGKSKK